MIDKVLKRIDQIPILPQNIQRLTTIVDDSKVSAAELVKIVEQDPALAIRCLRLCNSAYYSPPGEVSSVSSAIRLLGMDTVVGLAMAAYFQSLMPSRGNRTISYGLKGLQDHLLDTAQLSVLLAKSTGGADASATLFTAGLLHDVGKLVFSKLDHTIVQKVYEHVDAYGVPLVQAEQEIIGIDHAKAGGQLAARWQLPEVLVDAIKYHHDPFSGKFDQTFYVFLANKIANISNEESLIEEFSNDAEIPQVTKKISLSTEQISSLVDTWKMQNNKV